MVVDRVVARVVGAGITLRVAISGGIIFLSGGVINEIALCATSALESVQKT